MEKRSLIVLVFVLIACPHVPDPKIPDDTANCSPACERLRSLGCEEGNSLPDGTTCEKFCIDTQTSGHALDPTCIVSIETCNEISTKCGQ